jgi:hypothetical protein
MFPKDRSERGFYRISKNLTISVIYNGPVSLNRMKKIIIAPFITLLPFVVICLVVWPGALSILFLTIHLTACFADILMYYKYTLRNEEYIWGSAEKLYLKD